MKQNDAPGSTMKTAGEAEDAVAPCPISRDDVAFMYSIVPAPVGAREIFIGRAEMDVNFTKTLVDVATIASG